MEKEVMGKEEEEGGAGRLVIRSLCCLAGTGSKSLISKLYLIHKKNQNHNSVSSLVFSSLYHQRLLSEIFWSTKLLREDNFHENLGN